MLEYFKELLTGGLKGRPEEDKKNRVQIATCALLIEIASADDNFTEVERAKIIEIMKNTFSLSSEYVKELIEIAQRQIKSSVSLYEFTDIINLNFTREEKLDILLNLWRLIFVDDIMDKYEEFVVRRIASNLKLEHQDLIAAKLLARDERKQR